MKATLSSDDEYEVLSAGAAIVSAAGGKVSLENIQSDFRVDAKFSNNSIEQ